jgi:hypothetical protein
MAYQVNELINTAQEQIIIYMGNLKAVARLNINKQQEMTLK